jgi:cytochrome b subunit of formate dehydrogenase
VRAKNRVKRFTLVQRLFHLFLMLTFLTQAATGVARMYVETPWGRSLGNLFGGFESVLTVHIYVGIFMLWAFAIHILYVLFNFDWKGFPRSLLGPDSLIPNHRDLRQFYLHCKWIVGLSKHPPLDRWGYWEKFDYWAVFWGMVILGGTGLILAYPLASSRYIPGWGLNVLFWVHRIEAILAMAHIFIIHFFIAHLRRSSFPMDTAMFEGSVDLEATTHERPAWIARLREKGVLDDVTVPEASVLPRALYFIFGYAAISVGVFLLIGGLVNSGSITW